MPPFNATRHNLLAEAAIEVLAREGARGLTHRAVDTEAAVPPGTTSRYFRTRDALVSAVVARASAQHFAELRHPPYGPIDRTALTMHLTALVRQALIDKRSRHLAMCELFLESTRRPSLRAMLTEIQTEQVKWIRHIYHAAGIELTTRQATQLTASLTGLIFTALTTPDALLLGSFDEIDDLVRAMADALDLPPAAGDRPDTGGLVDDDVVGVLGETEGDLGVDLQRGAGGVA